MKKLFSLIIISVVLIISCKTEPEIVSLQTGLKFLDDTVGTGREVKMEDLLTIHYVGWTIRDTNNLFGDWTIDQQKMMYSIGNSKIRNQPVKFVLGTDSFIKGCDEGIVGMRTGGRRTIIIPSELAYGEKGIGPIPPNSDLKLVVEILEVKDRIVAEQWNVDPALFVTTESGLKYAIVREGAGNTPDSGNAVTVHYSGYLKGGTMFDSSVERDYPFSFILGMGQVIAGWDEGIRLMKKGGKTTLEIPPDLAYGELELEKIPANSTLIFDIELLDIQ